MQDAVGLCLDEEVGLVLRRDASEIVLGTQHVDLRRYSILRRLLTALLEQRERRPGAPLSLASLVAAGWPGERIQAKAARNRVHVALATLRQMGLRPFLIRDCDGYLLAPSLSIADAEAA
ncbi:MAG: hypothetical protein IPH07_17065 [Deltaproteobacteria bacterium]|nr:hypothetical protein [Deltaproteobacteria bacterium]MBP7289973.1 hypothetical protein [Nannocystaceae bacterium]